MDLQQKIRTLPTSAGVYLYKNADGQVVYVGRSENVFGRVSLHWNQWQRARLGLRRNHRVLGDEKVIEFDAIELVPVPMKDLAVEEQRLIQVHRPKHNKLLNRQPMAPGFEKSPVFRELLKRKQPPVLKIRRMTARWAHV